MLFCLVYLMILYLSGFYWKCLEFVLLRTMIIAMVMAMIIYVLMLIVCCCFVCKYDYSHAIFIYWMQNCVNYTAHQV